jgi:hypothetical protein
VGCSINKTEEDLQTALLYVIGNINSEKLEFIFTRLVNVLSLYAEVEPTPTVHYMSDNTMRDRALRYITAVQGYKVQINDNQE